MKRIVFALAALVALTIPQFLPVTADEGMWVPPAIGTRLPMETLKKMGFELTRDELWSEGEGSLRGAFLQVGALAGDGSLNPYGSASFVSAKGLVVTNHHVAFDAIAALSKPEENLIEDGFRSASMEEERHVQGLGMRITTMFEDVTENVLEGVTAETAEVERADIVAKHSDDLVAEATENGFEDVEVVEMLHGLAYYRVAYQTFRDIRLVYAPPRGIGEFGGDIDNWMWPRHTGDFTFLRVYVGQDGSRDGYAEDNVPFVPGRFLEVSIDGVRKGDFTFIMGYPGSTQRHDSSWAVEYYEKIELPQQLEGLKSFAATMEERIKDDPAAKIAAASDLKSIYNTIKNFEGKIEGLASSNLVMKKRAREDELSAWIKADEKRVAKYGTPFADLQKLYQEGPMKTGRMQGFIMAGPMTLYVHPQLAPMAGKVPADRAGRIADQLMARFIAPEVEKQREQLVTAFQPYWDEPESWRPQALSEVDVAVKSLEEFVAELLPAAVSRDNVISHLAGGEGADLPLAAFCAKLLVDMSAADEMMANFEVELQEANRRAVAADEAWTGAAIYPDANLTIRFTYGKVIGYNPRDAVSFNWFTTQDGITEKNTGENPFDAPERLVKLVEAEDYGRYADRKSGELVVNFLTDNDITGGNSGSPIMNGKGQLIGLAFDGNYEAMTSDYQFQPWITRTINVDSRYVLWVTEKVDGMTRLIEEMKIVGK